MQPAPPVAAAGQPSEGGTELSRARDEDPADRTGPRVPRSSRTLAEKPVTKAKPGLPATADSVVTTRTDVETQPIPFRTRVIRDITLPQGYRRVETPGTPGERTIRYEVTLVDGEPTNRRVVDTTVTRQPQQRVIVFGIQEDCVGALDLCLPLGRTACPQGDDADLPDPRSTVDESGAGPAAITDEDHALFDPELPADVRQEPATAC